MTERVSRMFNAVRDGYKPTRDDIIEALDQDDEFLEGSLTALAANQTTDELSRGRTKYHNGKGFSQIHAEFLSSLAGQLEDRGWLTDRQLEALRKRNRRGVPLLGQYWRQIIAAMEKQVLEQEPVC